MFENEETKLVLQSVMFSMEDYSVIQTWTEQNRALFDVIMPAGVAIANFPNIIFSQEIWGCSCSGILIVNHKKYGKSDLETAVRILRDRRKQLFAVSNGTMPVLGEQLNASCNREVFDLEFSDSGILRVLSECKSTLRWLVEEQRAEVVPRMHEEKIKCLERLGIVFRRERRTIELRKQRLKRVLERESEKLGFSLSIEDLIR